MNGTTKAVKAAGRMRSSRSVSSNPFLKAKNAAIPIITLSGDEAAALLNGAVVIETLFGWPGVGVLLIQAIERRDLPVIEAAVITIAIMIVIVNLVVDLIYARIDPRIHY